jgi:hypothetical protein
VSPNNKWIVFVLVPFGTQPPKMKLRLTKPHLKVDQPKSAFADGSARWTNKDLDPVPPDERKWGVISLIAVCLLIALPLRPSDLASIGYPTPSMLRHGNLRVRSSLLA